MPLVFTLDKAFSFPIKGDQCAIKISKMQSLSAFTVCLWVNSNDVQGTLFSYATAAHDNELSIDYYNRDIEVFIGGEKRLVYYRKYLSNDEGNAKDNAQ